MAGVQKHRHKVSVSPPFLLINAVASPAIFYNHLLATKEGSSAGLTNPSKRKTQAISDTIQALTEKGIYPSKSMVFRNAPGVSLADGRNHKLVEIWRVTLLGLS